MVAEEMRDAARRIATRDVVPGPDAVPGRVWVETMEFMAFSL